LQLHEWVDAERQSVFDFTNSPPKLSVSSHGGDVEADHETYQLDFQDPWKERL